MAGKALKIGFIAIVSLIVFSMGFWYAIMHSPSFYHTMKQFTKNIGLYNALRDLTTSPAAPSTNTTPIPYAANTNSSSSNYTPIIFTISGNGLPSIIPNWTVEINGINKTSSNNSIVFKVPYNSYTDYYDYPYKIYGLNYSSINHTTNTETNTTAYVGPATGGICWPNNLTSPVLSNNTNRTEFLHVLESTIACTEYTILINEEWGPI